MNTNKDKIREILEKYQNKEYDFETFYKDIIFLTHQQNHINIYKKATTQEKPIDLEYVDKKIKFKNYKLKCIGNMGGLNFGFVKNEFLKDSVSDEINNRVIKAGGKFYINTIIHCIHTIDFDTFNSLKEKVRQSEDRFEIKFNDNSYKVFDFKWSNVTANSIDLIEYDSNQAILTQHFVKDIFLTLDESNFVDAIGLKYYKQYDLRKDRINIYISKNIKENEGLSLKLVKSLKNLIKKYQAKGLKFDVNNFIMPYNYDNERIIANVYIPESFNKSLLYFILLYNTLDLKLAREIVYYHNRLIDDFFDVSNEKKKNFQEKVVKFIKNYDKKLDFEEFVYGIFALCEDCNVKDYLKTYNELFKF